MLEHTQRMNGERLNFITQTHEGRSRIVFCQANMIERLYPNSTFFIYDGGLDKESREGLSSISNTKIIGWKEEADFSSNIGSTEDILAKLETKIKENTYFDHILRKVFKYDYKYSDIIRWDFYMRQKPLSILDLTYKVDGNIFWMDDDAVIISRIDNMFDYEFDIGVTIVSDYSIRRYGGSPVNAGVLVFNTSSNVIQKFVNRWLKTIDSFELSTHREQNAIESILLESNEDIFNEYYNSGTITIDSSEIKIRVFPRRIYNHSHFINGIYPSENKILHLKGNAPELDVNKELVNDIIDEKIDNWNRGYPLEDHS